MNKTNLNEASNGQLTGLSSIGSGHKLNPEASDAYLKMVNAAKADGISWSITDSYRSLEGQNKLFDWDYFKKTKVRRKKGTAGTPAAYPGTSNHGWGAAVDLGVKYGDKSHTWLTKNASKFGFSNPFKKPTTEPWHWEHLQSAKNMGANVSTTIPDTSGSDYDSSSSSSSSSSSQATDYNEEGKNLLKGVLSTNLGLDDLAKGFANVQEDIKRIKNLMK